MSLEAAGRLLALRLRWTRLGTTTSFNCTQSLGSLSNVRHYATRKGADKTGGDQADAGNKRDQRSPRVDVKDFRYPYPLESIATFPLNCEGKAESVQPIDLGANKFRFPSVTKILERTRPDDNRQLLLGWQQGMTAKLGKEGFAKLFADKIHLGHCLHEALLMQYLTLQTPADQVLLADPRHRPYWHSLRSVLPHFGRLVAKESWVVHDRLCYKGQLDALVEFKNRLAVVELKVSDKVKSNVDSTYDAPLQLAAYVGAVNCTQALPKVDNALIIVCYQNAEASVFELDVRYLRHYWQRWLDRVSTFWTAGDAPTA